VSGGIDEKTPPFELRLVFDCYGKSSNEEGLILVCFEELGEGFEAAEEAGEVTRDELPSVVAPQQNAVGFVNGLLGEQRRSLFDHNVHDDFRRSPSLALEDRIEIIVDDVSDLLSDGRLNDIVNFARIHDNILSLRLERVRSGQRPQNISFI
jgi:hypothetical protein